MSTTTAPVGGSRARRSAQRRTQILAATAKTIALHGYHNSSLAQIAEEVGISAPSLLHHFRSKATLLTSLLDYRDEISMEEGLGERGAQGAELLGHLVDTARLNASRRGLTQLYAVLLGESLTDDHPATTYFRDRFTGLRRMVRGAVLAAIADESVPEEDVLEVACAIIAVMDGLQYQHLLDPSVVDMAAVTERTIRALLADLHRDPVDADEI